MELFLLKTYTKDHKTKYSNGELKILKFEYLTNTANDKYLFEEYNLNFGYVLR